MNWFMYRLGCHFLVALYMSTSCFRVRETARTNSRALRANRGSAEYTPRSVGTLALNVPTQRDKSRIWKVEARERGAKRCRSYRHSQLMFRRTCEVGRGTVVDRWQNHRNDDLHHVNEQQDVKYRPGSIPHCVNTQNHHNCNSSQIEQCRIRRTTTHDRQHK